MSVCPRFKRKNYWSINTKLGTHIHYGRTSECIDPVVRRSEVTRLSSVLLVWLCRSILLLVDFSKVMTYYWSDYIRLRVYLSSSLLHLLFYDCFTGKPLWPDPLGFPAKTVFSEVNHPLPYPFFIHDYHIPLGMTIVAFRPLSHWKFLFLNSNLKDESRDCSCVHFARSPIFRKCFRKIEHALCCEIKISSVKRALYWLCSTS